MFSFLKKHVYPIGVDIADEYLRLVQLTDGEKGFSLIAGGNERCPLEIKPGSSNWQRWAIEVLKKHVANNGFRGRDVIAAIPSSEVYIDHVTKTEADDEKFKRIVLSKIRHKLPFNADDAIIKHIPTEDNNVIIIATDRSKIDRYLAVYEKANLKPKSIAVWPEAMVNSYIRFFGRRKSDLEAVVILLDIENNCSKLVICRHKKLLFARSIPIGASRLGGDQAEEMKMRLILELKSCRQQFESMYRQTKLDRLVFLSPCQIGDRDREICTAIAKTMELPAQSGDCLAAVEIIRGKNGVVVDRRGPHVNWATAFGLSLF